MRSKLLHTMLANIKGRTCLWPRSLTTGHVDCGEDFWGNDPHKFRLRSAELTLPVDLYGVDLLRMLIRRT